jgi:LuxR family transcriptional regulator, maltose regulon positive regulatory protein
MDRDGGGAEACGPAPVKGSGDESGRLRFDAETLGFDPLGSKLRPARPQLELVTRQTLLRALAKSKAPLVLVSAPAGAGKSTLLMQWADADARPTAWVVLDSGDNDLVTFVRYLALAAAEVATVDVELFALLARPQPLVRERVVPKLAASLAEAPPFLLVLDDGHLVRRRECWRLLGSLLDSLPPGAQLAIGTRADPPLPLARLRTAGRLNEVRNDRLALNEAEAGELLRLRGVVMNDGELGATLAATEGWAAGIYLASLVAETLPPDKWVAHVRGDQTEIARYLTDEVLRRLPADTRTFLTQTSILDRLCAGVCAAVTGRADAGALLARIARRNLFVSALDDHGECYRYHHLFAELLRADLERREPDDLPRLHRAAAAWYAQHDDPEAAVAHRLSAGDVAGALHEAKITCAKLHQQEPDVDMALSARLLRLLDDREIMSDPSLTLMAGWTLGLVFGDRAEQLRWGPAACRVQADDGPCLAGAASWTSFQAILRVYLAPDGVSRMLEDAELAFRLESNLGNGRGWDLESASALGIARYLSGRGSAVGPLQAAAEGPWDRGDRGWAWAVLSLVHGDAGRWHEAAEADRQAVELEFASDLGFGKDEGYPALLPPLLSHARILSLRRDPELKGFLEEVARYLRRMTPQAEWMLLLAAVILGEIWLEQDDLDQASRWCVQALAILRRYPDAGMLGPRAHRLAQDVEERRMGEPLSTAEKRVLALLPTHLSAEEIAARLFVSPNTVRSHVQHIHRKLGAATRTEAVAKAQDLGLLSRDV